MMKRMGIKVDEIPAEKIIIKCADKDLIIDEPKVMRMKMPGQEMLQVMGEIKEGDSEESEEATLDISEEDIKMVAEQAEATVEQAAEALEASKGDLAEAIMKLKKEDA